MFKAFIEVNEHCHCCKYISVLQALKQFHFSMDLKLWVVAPVLKFCPLGCPYLIVMGTALDIVPQSFTCYFFVDF
jgi:hypothetical protein